jgi:hypothetical protein
MPDEKTNEIARRRREVARVLVKNPFLTYAEIAERFGVSKSTVCRDVQAITDTWKEENVSSLDRAKAKQIATLDFIESEALEAWRKSKEPQITIREETTEADPEPLTVGPDGISHAAGTAAEEVKRTTTAKETPGDPRFLKTALATVRDRSELLGLHDQPTHVNTGKVQRLADAIRAVAADTDLQRFDGDLIGAEEEGA